jgi:hypothetical protein
MITHPFGGGQPDTLKLVSPQLEQGEAGARFRSPVLRTVHSIRKGRHCRRWAMMVSDHVIWHTPPSLSGVAIAGYLTMVV